MEKCKKYIEDLNHADVKVRLESLKKLMVKIEKGKLPRPVTGKDVNNHIHTFYSFSPYSPAKAVWMAYNAGLCTAGIMDHDSIAGAREFIEAGKIVGIPATIGVECRVDFSGTPLKGKRINNPDQSSIAYMALHGIPHTNIEKVREFFKPFTAERNKRNVEMVRKINEVMASGGISLDFERDVVPVSKFTDGGSITERHISLALSRQLIDKYGKGEALAAFLKEKLELNINSKLEGFLSDTENEHYEYDLLGLIKSDIIGRFYVDATAECPPVEDVISFAKSIGAVSAYAYLGDVGDSVTGDKKTQKFEDDYIELLFEQLKLLRFNAVTYMPSRNTRQQLLKIKGICEKNGLFQISGEDINSPRQSFICAAMRDPEFKNLYDSTWALIGHEKAATENPENGMFTRKTLSKHPELNERIKMYKKVGMK